MIFLYFMCLLGQEKLVIEKAAALKMLNVQVRSMCFTKSFTIQSLPPSFVYSDEICES